MGVAPRSGVYVLLVNWNGLHHLERCLPSLMETRFPFTPIVLDNGSCDGSQRWLLETYPQVRLFDLGRNLGFAEANNIGLRVAVAEGARYAVLLNNDTRVEPDWLETLVDVAEANPQAAVCGAQQRTWDGQRELHFRFIPQWAEAQSEEIPISPAGAESPTLFVSGCAMLLRCAALKQIGLFDERYFAGVEDVDLTLRAWITGYQALDVPRSIVYHRFGGSGQEAKRMYWGYRNQLTTIFKLYQTETLRAFAPAIVRRWFVTRNRTALRATLASLAMLPGTLARRRQVQRRRVLADDVILRLVNS